MTEENALYMLLAESYTVMLKIPLASPLRLEDQTQSVLAAVRDALAVWHHLDDETVQTLYEQRAASLYEGGP